jgi:Leucine-rich repeat (LRR) protein
MNRLAWLPSLKGMTRVTQLQLSCAIRQRQSCFIAAHHDDRYNCLKTVHFSVSALVSLNLICLEHNMLKQLPPEIFECPKVLRCFMITLQSCVSTLDFKQVAALLASHNEIDLLPRNIHLSYHLADVQLHCNQLVTLDPSLFAATSITSLRLDSNLITNLPDDVASASSLQVARVFLCSCARHCVLLDTRSCCRL